VVAGAQPAGPLRLSVADGEASPQVTTQLVGRVCVVYGSGLWALVNLLGGRLTVPVAR
jgi:hypothetical protein